VTVKKSSSTIPTTHNIVTGGGPPAAFCVKSIENHTTTIPSTWLPVSPMKVRGPRHGIGALKARNPTSAPISTTRNFSALASPIIQAKNAK